MPVPLASIRPSRKARDWASQQGNTALLIVLQNAIEHLPAGDQVAQDTFQALPVDRMRLRRLTMACSATVGLEDFILAF